MPNDKTAPARQAREFVGVPASRQGSKLRLALTGPSGSGKTWTALEIVTAMASVTGGTIALIDTERQSAGLYAPPFKFTHYKWTGSYSPQRLVRCLAEVAEDGHEYAILDTWSRFWGGPGGMLEQVDENTRGSFSGWQTMRPIENQMIEALLGVPFHMVTTMRVKTAFEVGRSEEGKVKPVKIGLKPEQRENVESEFNIVGDLDLDHRMTFSKTRCSELDGMSFVKPGVEVAKILLDWLGTIESAPTAIDFRDIALAENATFASVRKAYKDAAAEGVLGAAVIDPVTGGLMQLENLLKVRGDELHTAETASQPKAA